MPLVIAAASADIIATLITLKAEAEAKLKTSLKFTIIGGAEAHILAKELGDANIGVILSPARPFPNSWEERRMYVCLFARGDVSSTDYTYATVFRGRL